MTTKERDLTGQQYINVIAELPDKDFYPIAEQIWKALDRNNIKLAQDAELSLRVYNFEEYTE